MSETRPSVARLPAARKLPVGYRIFLCIAVDVGLWREWQHVGQSWPIFLAGVVTLVTISVILLILAQSAKLSAGGITPQHGSSRRSGREPPMTLEQTMDDLDTQQVDGVEYIIWGVHS